MLPWLGKMTRFVGSDKQNGDAKRLVLCCICDLIILQSPRLTTEIIGYFTYSI